MLYSRDMERRLRMDGLAVEDPGLEGPQGASPLWFALPDPPTLAGSDAYGDTEYWDDRLYVPVPARMRAALRNGAPFRDWPLPANLGRVRHRAQTPLRLDSDGASPSYYL